MNKLISIYTCSNQHTASFLKEKFEFDEVECFLTDKDFTHDTSSIEEGLKLKVRERDTEKAIQVLLKIHKQYDLETSQD